ncbi:uncharacterized protein Proc [Euwallacea similis]|uniref:uncharacterized protein Proc n=1 Tax=Euwallacea similis TaxID=1736056 RepID=UPI00344EDD05
MASILTITIVSVLIAVLVLQHDIEARYLPTRSNGDRVDKIRELLKDLLESELETGESSDVQRWMHDGKYYVKREAKFMRDLPDKTNEK